MSDDGEIDQNSESADRTERGDPRTDRAENGEGIETDADGDDPFVELSAVDAERSPEEIDDLFESVETADVDESAVWEDLLSDEDESVEIDATETGADATVPKDQYCKRCAFFSEPPEVSCNNPGTQIEELVGIDKFQVRNCPVVVQRRQVKPIFSERDGSKP